MLEQRSEGDAIRVNGHLLETIIESARRDHRHAVRTDFHGGGCGMHVPSTAWRGTWMQISSRSRKLIA